MAFVMTFGITYKTIIYIGFDMNQQLTDLSESQAKKAIQKLQKCIVNALEDVKAVDIRVFNTESISPLFERVIIASGNSNRQTKALASSVRDQLKEEGFPKPRSEGEENGEWIIVDCGAAVVHIMQPAIRQYYHLEDIWGDKPVRLRAPAAKSTEQTQKKIGHKKRSPSVKSQRSEVKTKAAKSSRSSAAKSK